MFPTDMSRFDRLDSDSMWKWREFRDLPRSKRAKTLKEAFEDAREEYAEEGSLSGFELIDDAEEES